MAFRIVPQEKLVTRVPFKMSCPLFVPNWTYPDERIGGRGNKRHLLGVRMGESEAKPKETAKG